MEKRKVLGFGLIFIITEKGGCMKKQKQIDSLKQRVSDLEFEFALFQKETVKDLLEQITLLNSNLQTLHQTNQMSDNKEKQSISTKQLIDEWVNGEGGSHG